MIIMPCPDKLRALKVLFAIVAMLAVQDVFAGIFNTKHNLGSTGLNATSNFSGTKEICVFCHTPHGGDGTAAAPLWNRYTTPGTFQTYDQSGSSTLDAHIEPVGSVSVACLSCHDGTQAMDTLINQPGSGAVVPAFSSGAWSGLAATNNGRLDVRAITNLGKDLTNDHPIGVQYAGGGYSESNPAGDGVDKDFMPAESKIEGTSRVWWVNNTGEGDSHDFEKVDMKLYTRVATAGVNAGEPQPYVECASCHDPHVDKNPTFLRRNPAGSAVCLTCHIK